MPRNNPPNSVPKLPAYPDSDISYSDSILSDSSESPDGNYYTQRKHTKKNKKKHWSKMCFNDPIKKCANLTAKIITFTYKSKVVRFKLDEDPLQHRFYLLSFMNSLLKIITI